MTDFVFRKPCVDDAAEIHAFLQPYKPYVGTSPVYTYLLICRHFSETSVVVESAKGEIVGFVSAFPPPKEKDTVFIWEIGVKKGFHGNNLYIRMIEAIGMRVKPDYIDFTVNPSNTSSIRRIYELARLFGCDCQKSSCFPAHLFGNQPHEDEDLYRLGPISYDAG